MYYRQLILGFLFSIFAVSCTQNKTPNIDIHAQIEQFSTQTDQIVTKSYAVDNFKNHLGDYKTAFQNSFPKTTQHYIIDNASQKQLSELRIDVHNHLLTANDPEALIFFEAIYNKQRENNWLEDNDDASIYRLYLSLRQFKKASEFKQAHSDKNFQTGLKVHGWDSYTNSPSKGKRFVFDTVEDKDYLELSHVDFSNYTGVVVIGSPQCHFFNNFLKSVGDDSSLSAAFLNNTIWLTNAYLTDNQVIDWNQSMPNVQFQYRVYAKDWPEINYWGTPSFYFFLDGKLSKKVVGWPRNAVDERTLALIDGFKSIGIETASTATSNN